MNYLAVLGLPSALTGLFFWLLERRITKIDRNRARAEEAREQKAKAAEEAREQMSLCLLEGTTAAIALGEATARAVQRIPDAHCNGDMHEALNYAADVKHRQRDFITKQGVHALHDDGGKL